MIHTKDLAKAVGGKTARACDSCIKKRARWYCAADDAFLCQSCDSSVHSANPLARRHERVRLKTASLKSLDLGPKEEESSPSWHGGFTRKVRTPRHGKPAFPRSKKDETAWDVFPVFPLVPEVGSDDICNEDINDEEEHLLYRVPIYDPFVSELCASTAAPDECGGFELKAAAGIRKHEVDCLHGFLQSDMDLAEFAADVENLLGKGLENESFGMEELGFMDCKEEEREISGRIKVEEEAEDGGLRVNCGGGGGEEVGVDMGRDQVAPFEFSFEFDESSGATCTVDEGCGEKNEEEMRKKKVILLSLDYDAVIAAWATQGSPWTTGNRPNFDPNESWPECMRSGWNGVDGSGVVAGQGGGGGGGMGDGGREARVSRYREKRRTRLFSKKIRYEVRKLNAEKRPRMKGRFVKRAALAASALSLHNK